MKTKLSTIGWKTQKNRYDIIDIDWENKIIFVPRSLSVTDEHFINHTLCLPQLSIAKMFFDDHFNFIEGRQELFDVLNQDFEYIIKDEVLNYRHKSTGQLGQIIYANDNFQKGSSEQATSVFPIKSNSISIVQSLTDTELYIYDSGIIKMVDEYVDTKDSHFLVYNLTKVSVLEAYPTEIKLHVGNVQVTLTTFSKTSTLVTYVLQNGHLTKTEEEYTLPSWLDSITVATDVSINPINKHLWYTNKDDIIYESNNIMITSGRQVYIKHGSGWIPTDTRFLKSKLVPAELLSEITMINNLLPEEYLE
ncbi:hypothetical protein D3C78_19730 [compost metagenome]